MLRIARQKGLATIMLTMVVLMIVTLTTLYTSRIVVTDDKIFASNYRNAQALDAARAGFDYALGFLNQTLLSQEMVLTNNTMTRDAALPGGNNLNRCSVATNTATLTAPGALANGATFAMTYRCMVVNDVNTIIIRSVGTASDGSSVRTVQATVQEVQPAFAALTSTGIPGLTGGSDLSNTVNNSTKGIISGSTITITGGGTTLTTSAGVCTSVATCNALSPPAITQNYAPLTALTTESLFQNYFMADDLTDFGATSGGLPTRVDYILTCTASVSYTSAANALDTGGSCTIVAAAGVTPASPTWAQVAGRSVYINMTSGGAGNTNVSFGTATFGAAATPITVIVSRNNTTANTTLTNSADFFGSIYTRGNAVLSTSGTVMNGVFFSSNDYTQNAGTVNGVVIARTTPAISNSGTLINRTSATHLGYVMSASVLGFAVVPGSMKDF